MTIHIRQAAIEIPKSLRDDNPRYKDSPPVVLSDLKTEASRRAVDISPDAVRALRTRRSAALREGLRDCPLVFPTTTGALLSKSNFLREVWVPIRKTAGIPAARFHDLRHTTAVLFLMANVNPKVPAAAWPCEHRSDHVPAFAGPW